MAGFEIKRHDLRPFFVVVLKDDYGEATESVVNLTTAGSAVFNMRQRGSAVAKISRGSASITNATAGEVTYKWQLGDTDTVGTFDSEVEVIWSDLKPETFPGGPSGGNYWEIDITDDLA